MIFKTTQWMKPVSALTLGILAVGIATSCSNNPDDELLTTYAPVEAVFSAQISAPTTRSANGTPATRATGTVWDNGDQIGIFMLTSGGSPTNIETVRAANYPYVVDLTEHSDDTIDNAYNFLKAIAKGDGGSGDIYMQPGEAYDFISYYPFTATANLSNGYQYPISLANQYNAKTSADHDLLYATSSRENIKSNKVSFEFNHMLSNITINVTRGKGVDATDYANKNAVITGMPTTALFDLSDGFTFTELDDIAAITSAKSDDDGDLYEVIILPQSAGVYKGRAITFSVSGTGYYWFIPDGFAYEAGKRYTYTFTLTSGGLEIVGDVTISEWGNGGNLDNGSGWGNGVKEFSIATVSIPAGTFMMGSDANTNETPIHEVTLSAFKMSKYQITVKEYCNFLNANLDNFTSTTTNVKATLTGKDEHGIDYEYTDVVLANANALSIQYNGSKWYPAVGRDNHPMTFVTWHGAFAFANWAGGHLPTEAQWEYASKAGSTDVTATGNYGLGVTSAGDPTPVQITTSNLGDYAWYIDNNTPETGDGYPAGAKPVGLKLPNVWGLYDMHGNVYEWCYDWFAENFYSEQAATASDPVNTTSTSDRMVSRGGKYDNSATGCRSAFRNSRMPSNYNDLVGFRVVFL